jgi:Tfp pilus assembly protein PilN
MAESRGRESDRLFGWIDLLVAGVALSAVTTVILIAGASLQTRLDAAEATVRQRVRANSETKATVEQLEKARVRNTQVQQLVERQLADVETRAALHWTPALADLSKARPEGVWLTRVSLQGVKLRVEGEAGQPDRAAAYANRLLQSACFDYVAPAAAAPTGGGTFVLVGRKAGD